MTDDAVTLAELLLDWRDDVNSEPHRPMPRAQALIDTLKTT